MVSDEDQQKHVELIESRIPKVFFVMITTIYYQYSEKN